MSKHDRVEEQTGTPQVHVASGRKVRELEPVWAWLGGRRFWTGLAVATVVVLVVLGLKVHRVYSQQAGSQEAFLYGRSMITPGEESAFRIFVRNGVEGTPVVGAIATAVLRCAGPKCSSGRQTTWRGRVISDVHGLALLSPRVPADAVEGRYLLEVRVRSGDGHSTVRRVVTVKRSFRVLVTTDKPVYQPGQSIRIRTMTLANADLRPVAKRSIVIRVLDPRRNLVFRKRLRTSRFGIAATQFRLAHQVNLGRYRVISSVGDTTFERTVQVKRYRLPRFRVDLSANKRNYLPQDTLRGELSARYPFGKPVARASVTIQVASPRHSKSIVAAVSGKTDTQGRFSFELPLKAHAGTGGDSWVQVTAAVTDSAKQRHEQSLTVSVTNRVLRVAAIPESGVLVPGVKNVVYVVAAYADGRPAARAMVRISGLPKPVRLSEAGVARVMITPRSSGHPVSLVARDSTGNVARFRDKFPSSRRTDGLLLRTDRALYRTGQPVRVSVLSSGGDGRVLLDVVRDQRTVVGKELNLRSGRAELSLDLPKHLSGTMELHAYRIRSDGSWGGDTRIIQVSRPSGLQIHAELDKSLYRPAQRALLKLAVKRADGAPVQAALSIAAVDEAVYALQASPPGLERIHFLLRKQLLRSRRGHPPWLESGAVDAASRAASGHTVSPDKGLAVFATTAASKTKIRTASRTHVAKSNQLEWDKGSRLQSWLHDVPVALIVLFLMIIMPVLLYALWRMLRPPCTEKADEDDERQLRRSGVRLAAWWALGLYATSLGVLAILATERRIDYRLAGDGLDWPPFIDDPSLWMLLGAFALSTALCFGMQVLWAWRFRRNPASAAVPLLRKLLMPLPVAYLVAVVACCSVVAVREPILSMGTRSVGDYVELLGVLFAGAFLMAAVLIVVLRGLLHPAAAWRRGATAGVLFVALAMVPGVTGGWLLSVPSEASGAGGGESGFESDSLEGKGRFSRVSRDASRAARIRRHFPETLFWRPELITDAKGHATFPIQLADSITTWRLRLSAVSERGQLGATTRGLQVFQDFFVDLDLPEALTQHDRIQVPVVVHNYLDRAQTVELVLKHQPWYRLHGSAVQRVTIGAQKARVVHFTLTALEPGRHSLRVRASGDKVVDAVERRVRVAPNGRRMVQTVGGLLEKTRTHRIVIPAQALDGASDLWVKIFPGALSQVVEGLENIFEMPYGCFEQTSSTTYPNVLVLDYLKRTNQLAPALANTAKQYVGRGYQRLLSFELATGGFSWFGKAPADPVLTAYGLMLLADMARVHPVDSSLLARTREHLLDTQHDDGFWWPRNRTVRGKSASVRSRVRTTAYIAWAMLEATKGKAMGKGLKRALAYVHKHVTDERDAYTLALAANALVVGKHSGAGSVLARLAGLVRRDKHGAFWSSKSRGVVFSSGRVLRIETTALAVLALLRAGHAPLAANQGLGWLVAHKDLNGTWHSTQATILSLRVLLQSIETTARHTKPIRVRVTANGRTAKELAITPDNRRVLRLVSLRGDVQSGANSVSISASSKGLFYQVVATHHVPWARPPSLRLVGSARKATTKNPTNAPFGISVRYASHRLRTGARLSCRVTLRSNRPGEVDMVIAEIGIPPGFQLDRSAFKALVKTGRIERFRVSGRHVTVYLRRLKANKFLRFEYHLLALRPATVRTPRSQIYAYYEPSMRAVATPVVLQVVR